MPNDNSAAMSNRYEDLLQTKRNIESGVTISGKPIGFSEIGYQDKAELWASLSVGGAQQAGITPQQFLRNVHSFGMSPNESHQVLVDLFPEDMRSSGHYNERVETTGGIFGIGGEETVHIERTFPTQQELRQWMRSRGYVDPKLAYQQMLEEAAR
jgi:hypothetical protein